MRLIKFNVNHHDAETHQQKLVGIKVEIIGTI